MNVLPYYPIEEHRCRFLYVVGSGVKPGVEGKRRPGREIEPMSSPENRIAYRACRSTFRRVEPYACRRFRFERLSKAGIVVAE